MVEVKGLYLNYSNFQLDNINFTVEENEFFSILGPSGCGKSTILEIIAKLNKDYSGVVKVDGRDIKEVDDGLVGIVFQEALLFPHLNVVENVAFGLKMKGIKKRERMEKAKKYLNLVNLAGYEKRGVSSLSGGEKQRVSIARTLVLEPKILLMDEPFSALDYNLRIEMQELISYIHKKTQATIVFVTHDREEAFSLSHRIAIMDRGRVSQVGRSHELYYKPNNLHIAKFLGCKNIFDGSVKAGLFTLNKFNLETNLSNGSYTIAIRPEEVKVSVNRGIRVKEVEAKLINGYYQLVLDISNTKVYCSLGKEDYFKLKGQREYFINIHKEAIIAFKKETD